MKISILFLLTTALLQALTLPGLKAQTSEQVFREETINDQFRYIGEKTKIYENYRAIREDMFQNLSRNVRDTLTSIKNSVSSVRSANLQLTEKVDSLTSVLLQTQSQLEEETKTKNSLKFLGINIRKTAYNIIMWGVVVILGAMLAAGYRSFKNNRDTAISASSELENLKTEYEEFRKKARMEREKMSTEHFNELKRLRGK